MSVTLSLNSRVLSLSINPMNKDVRKGSSATRDTAEVAELLLLPGRPSCHT